MNRLRTFVPTVFECYICILLKYKGVFLSSFCFVTFCKMLVDDNSTKTNKVCSIKFQSMYSKNRFKELSCMLLRKIRELWFILFLASMVAVTGCTEDDKGESGDKQSEAPVTTSNPGFIVSSINGDTGENGDSATFTVKLRSQPTAEVLIPLQSSDTGEGTISVSQLIFTTQNWNSNQTVTVVGVNDELVDGDQKYEIKLELTTSDDPNYNNQNPSDVAVINIDNNTAGFTVGEASGSTGENGRSTSFPVRLNSQPTDDVTVPVSSANTGEGTVHPSSLTFTSQNWNANQFVTATGVDDELDDGNQIYMVLLGVSSSVDASYDGLNPADVSITNVDNDTAGFTVSNISGKTGENGSTATFTVQLNCKPSSDVTIPLSSSNTEEGIITQKTLYFTDQNWNANQTVTVTGVDDDLVDGNQDYTIVLGSATSDGSDYNNLDPSDVAVVNTDNDSAGFIIGDISGSTGEDGTTATFTVKLTSQPIDNVTVSISSSNIAEGTVTPSNITFTSRNWNANQIVTVTGVDDYLADGNQSYKVKLGAAISNDENYQGTDPSDVSVINTDNDSPGFLIGDISQNTGENGSTATFTVKLTSQPTGNVAIPISSSDAGEGVVNFSSVTFTEQNWNANQVITVTGVDDYLIDGHQNYTILLGLTSSVDPNYHNLNPSDISVINIDNDTAGVTIGNISGNTAEDGTTATFTVKLTSQPTANVTIPIESSDTGEGTITVTNLLFTDQNWDANQTVTVTGINDDLDDGNQSYTIRLGVVISDDTDYKNLDPSDVMVINIDNDSAGFTIGAISGNTGENGTSATFTVKLTSQPAGDVSIPISSSNTTEGTVTPATLTFTSQNWNANQTVTVTGVDDELDDGNQNYTIYLGQVSSNQSDYDKLNPDDVSVINTDNDTAGFTVGDISGNIGEDGTVATFTIKLNAQPYSDVTIPIRSSDTGEGEASPKTLVFTSENWNANQTVTVTGVDDYLVDGNQSLTIYSDPATSNNSDYNGLDPADVIVTNVDNDSAGFTVGAISGNTGEDESTATFTVKLTSQPTADVSVPVSSSNTNEGVITPSTLIFTDRNWNANQTVTVTGVNDYLIDGNQSYTIQLGLATSADSDYNNQDPADVTVTNIDNDSAGVTVGAISGNTGEDGSTATFTVKLNSQPTGNVTIPLSSSDSGEGTVSPTLLTFTDQNWNANQIVTVTGVNDNLNDGNQNYQVKLEAMTSGDSDYHNTDPSDVMVINIDNDSAGFTIGNISGNTREDGVTATFTVKLTSQPTASVTVPVESSDLGEGTVSPATLLFTDQNWNASQIVTVTGVDDALDDGNQNYMIRLGLATSDDSDYNIDPADVSVVNVDNDSAGFTIGTISGNTAEEGTTATFTVKLNSQPASNVTIPVSTSDPGEGSVSATSLLFTDQNWNQNQTITVTGVNDNLDDGNQSYMVRLGAVSSNGSDYDGLDPADVTVINVDNDTAGFTISNVSGDTGEDGTTATFTVKLNSQPTSNVTIAVSSSNTNEGTVSTDLLVFTLLNWHTEQTVTITGVDDILNDGDQTYTIQLGSASSQDSNYNGMNPADLSVKNINDDLAGFIVSAISNDTDETGKTATFTVKLNSQPLDDVTFSVSSSDVTEGIVSHSSLTFTADNWNVAQTVTVTGLDDSETDFSKKYEIAFGAVSSNDVNYNGKNVSNLSIMNVDDDWKLPDTGQNIKSKYLDDFPEFGMDSDYSTDPPSFTDNGDGTVTENNTKLIWQKGDSGVQVKVGSSDLTSYCESLSLAGYNDWRLPTTTEIQFLFDYNSSGIVDKTLFSEDHLTYWSQEFGKTVQYFVSYSGSLVDSTPLNYVTAYIRCVRSDYSLESLTEKLVDNENGTLSDLRTNLTWQKKPSEERGSFRRAVNYCEDLVLAGYSDWRVPNKFEITSVFNLIKAGWKTRGPLLDLDYSASYWTSTIKSINSRDVFTFTPFYELSATDSSLYTYLPALCVR